MVAKGPREPRPLSLIRTLRATFSRAREKVMRAAFGRIPWSGDNNQSSPYLIGCDFPRASGFSGNIIR